MHDRSPARNARLRAEQATSAARHLQLLHRDNPLVPTPSHRGIPAGTPMLACTAHAVCEVQGYDPNAPFDRRDQDELDRFAQFVVVAACEAAYGAGLPDGSLDAVSMRVTTGCALGGKETEDAGFWRLYAEQKSRLSPFSVPRVMGGAGGALEAVITVLAIARGCIPPNVGTTKVAPDCDLGIPLSAEARSIDVALSNSFAFGGLNAVLAFQRC